jgi:hypothetical protein
MPKSANLTGETYIDYRGITIYHLTCPYCGLGQWHPSGTHHCIYICNKEFNVTQLKIIRPEPSPEKEDNGKDKS